MTFNELVAMVAKDQKCTVEQATTDILSAISYRPKPVLVLRTYEERDIADQKQTWYSILMDDMTTQDICP